MRIVRGLMVSVSMVFGSISFLSLESAPVSASGSCTVKYLTTEVVGGSTYTYGLIEAASPKAPCRLNVPSSSDDISFLIVGGGGSSLESLDGAAGGGGAGGVVVHSVTTPPTADAGSFPFTLLVGSRDESTELDYVASGGAAIQIKAGEGGGGGRGSQNQDLATTGFPGGAGDAPGSGGGGAVGSTSGESGGSAGGSGAYAGGNAFVSGYANAPNATGGGGGGARGVGADGTDDATGGFGGQGVSFAAIFPIPTAFATAANLTASIAEGGDGYAMGTQSTPSSPSFGSGANGRQGFSPGGSGVIIVRYGVTLGLDTSKGSGGLDPSSIVDGRPMTFTVYLSGTTHVPSDPNSPKVSAIEWLDSQGQSLSPSASCGANDVTTVANSTEEYAVCPGYAMPSLSVGLYNIKLTMTDQRELVTAGAPFQVNAGMNITNVSPSQIPNEGTQTITITGSNLPASNHPTLRVILVQFRVGQGGGGPAPGPMSSQSVGVANSYSDTGNVQQCAVDTLFAGPGIRCSFDASGFYLRTASLNIEESQGNATGANVTFVPTISGVTPGSGTASGGESITITGTGLLNAGSVDIGGVPATVDTNANNTRTSLTVITSVSATDGAKDVSLVVPAPTDQDLTATMTATAIGAFTYNFANALVPAFDTPVATADGFMVNVTNYDPAFTWGTPSVSSGSVSAGVASGPNLPLTVTGLSASVSATVTITNSRTGYNAGSGTVQGTSQAAAPTRPDPPAIGQLTPGDGQVTVSVMQAGTGGVPTTITVTSSGGQSCQVSGSSGACTVTALTNGVAYTFTAVATNGVGSSASTSSSSAVIPSTTPGAPTVVSGVIGNTQVTVSWTAPSDTGGSAITGYKVESSVQGSGTWTVESADTGSITTAYTVTGLSNGTAYVFRVSALNANGSSAPSLTSSAVTPINPPDAPNQPTAIAGAGSATVTVSAGGGGTPTSYTVRANPGGASCTVNGASGSCTVTSLINGTAYTFTATATNADGTSAVSPASASVTPSTTPGQVTAIVATRGDTQALLSWSAPSDTGGLAITGYKVESSIQGSGTWTVESADTGSTTTAYTATGLTNGTSYVFRVSALNNNGTGLASLDSNAVTPASLPGTPSGLAAVHGDGQVTLTWTPASSGVPGQPLTGHSVETSTDGGTTWVSAIADTGSGTGTATVTGLTNGTSYLFRVAGISSAGTGLPLTIGSAVTPSTTPSAVTGLIAQVGDQQVTLSWTAGFDGGSSISGYTIEKNDGTGWTVVSANTNSSSTSHTVNGLTNGATYNFRVTPINANGTSTVLAPNLTNAVSPIMAPGVPPAPTVTAGAGSVMVTVSAGSGGTPSSYTVTARDPNNQSAGSCSVTGASGSCTISGLAPGVAYTVTVTASNANTTSVSSAASASVTPLATTGASTPTSGNSNNPTAGGTNGTSGLSSINVAGGRELNSGGTRPSTPILSVDGAVPEQPSGKVQALVDGRVEQVDVTRTRTGALAVAHSDFNLRFMVTRGAGGVVSQGDAIILTLSPAGTLAVSGSGFTPGSVIDIWLFSKPRFLGMVTVGSDGKFSGDVTVPRSMALGDHTLQANGIGSDGKVRSLALGIEVKTNLVSLPETGGDILVLVIGPWLLFLIGLVMVSQRRLLR